MVRNLIGGALLIGISAPGMAQTPSVAKPQFEAWKACVINKADRYSKSPDSAEVIAKVAVLACKDEEAKFVDQLIAERVDLRSRDDLDDRLRRMLAEDAAVFVMELRTKK